MYWMRIVCEVLFVKRYSLVISYNNIKYERTVPRKETKIV